MARAITVAVYPDGAESEFATIHSLLQRLERKGLVEGKWVEKAGERRKRYYKLTAAGRKSLAEQRKSWRAFVRALNQLTGFSHA